MSRDLIGIVISDISECSGSVSFSCGLLVSLRGKLEGNFGTVGEEMTIGETRQVR